MSAVGIDDPGVQNSLLEFFKQDELGKRKVRQTANRLAYALRNNANPDLINQMMKEYKDCLDSDKSRREQAQKSLDGQIGYSGNPRLEAILLLMGVLGDGSSFVPASLLSSRPTTINPTVNNQAPGDPGRDVAGDPGRDPGRSAPPGLLPSANTSTVLGGSRIPFENRSSIPRAGTDIGPNTRTDNNPFGVARTGDTTVKNTNNHGNFVNVPETPPLPTAGRTHSAEGNSTAGGATAAGTTGTGATATVLPPPRPLPPSPKGTTNGTVDKKGADWIDIRAEDGTVERYMPAWRGGAQGGFDPKIVQIIQDLGIGDKVQADWEFFERKRIVKLVPLAPDHKDDKN